MITIKQLFDYDTWTYTYLLWDNKTLDAIIIDPVLEQVDRDLDVVEKLNLNLTHVFETHVHADHITAATILKQKANIKICYGSKSKVKGADILFEDGEKFILGDNEIVVHHTPGHTSGCVSYYVDGYVFTGDTLFIEGTGRTDFQGGSSSDTYESVRRKIFSYPDNTVVYPGHNYNGFLHSTIGYERKFNPNVGDHINKETFIKNEKLKNRPYPKRFDIAVPANMKCGQIKK